MEDMLEELVPQCVNEGAAVQDLEMRLLVHHFLAQHLAETREGGFDERARMSLAAGCDIVLHCSGDMAEMLAAAKGCSQMSAAAAARLERGEAMRQGAMRDEVPSDTALARLEELLA